MPIGMAKDAKLVKPVAIDTPITFDDVELDELSTILSLYKLQEKWMAGDINENDLLVAVENLI